MNQQSPIGRTQVQDEPQPTPSGEVGEVKAAHERIGVGSGDENVARIQLAARWAEAYAPPGGDSLEEALSRFNRAFNYIDAVTHNVDPPNPRPAEG